MSVAVVIPAYNEERHIKRALMSVVGFADEIFVIDSYSTDSTCSIALEFGAKVVNVKFVSFAQKFQWGLDNAPISSDWVFRLDADEYVDDKLANEIQSRLSGLAPSVVGININRQYVFLDRMIRYGGRNPLIQLRLWRNGMGRMEARLLDEHIVLSQGKTVQFDGSVIDHNLLDLTQFIAKHNTYATREALEILCRRYGLKEQVGRTLSAEHSPQATLKRFVKEQIYSRLPLGFGPFAYFLYRYILRLGFLDGTPGLIYHFLQGGWYRFLVNAKVFEYEKALRGLNEKDDIRKELSRVSNVVL